MHENLARAFALLGDGPELSENSIAALSQMEAKLGQSLPSVVKEFYALDGAIETLRACSNDDEPVPLDSLGRPIEDWYGAPKDFAKEGLVWFLQENQGVCNWAFRLDGGEDPPVVVEVDTAPSSRWQPCAERFSEFIYCQIWDHDPGFTLGLQSQDRELDPHDLEEVRSCASNVAFETHGWPGRHNYRFEIDGARVLIWDCVGQADWWIRARDAESLYTAGRAVIDLGCLRDRLWVDGDESEAVLARLRG